MQKNGNFRLEPASGSNVHNQDLPPGPRVGEIRKQWVVHEDEALAYRLQNEEINEFYSGNRVRNATVREDIPCAKEIQLKEEREALEQRMKYLRVLHLQAEEDAKLANELTGKYERLRCDNPPIPSSALEVDFDCLNGAGASENPSSFSRGVAQAETVRGATGGYSQPQQPARSSLKNSTSSHLNKPKSIAHSPPQTSPKPCCSTNSYRMGNTGGVEFQSFEPSISASADPIPPPLEFSSRNSVSPNEALAQLEKDAEIARILQEELEQEEMERRLAVEAQDRELAKMLHNKEKAKIKRAKERSKLKHANSSNSQDSANESQSEGGHEGSRSSIASGGASAAEKEPETFQSPPKIPEKSKLKLNKDDPIGFRANPKPLPPSPNKSQPEPKKDEYPIPPYMPLNGGGIGVGESRSPKKKK